MTSARLGRLRSHYWPLAAREWDRLAIAGLFVAFGVADLATPDMTLLGQYIEPWRAPQFIVAGLVLMYGVLRKSYLARGVGTILWACGLATIAVQVILTSGSVTLYLMAAFALMGFADLRRLRRKNVRERVDDIVARVHRRGGG